MSLEFMKNVQSRRGMLTANAVGGGEQRQRPRIVRRKQPGFYAASQRMVILKTPDCYEGVILVCQPGMKWCLRRDKFEFGLSPHSF